MITEILTTIGAATLGVLTGLIPGIHPNLIASSLFSTKESLLLVTSGMNLAIFIVILSLANSIANFIPSCYLGAPETDNCLTTLPGHRYLKKGKAHEAIILTTISSVLATIVLIILTPLLIKITPAVYNSIKQGIGYILIMIVIFTVVKEKQSKVLACIVFLLASVLGMITLNMNNVKEPLLPLLSGLFGIPALLLSIKNKETIPPQELSFPKVKKRLLWKTQWLSFITGYMFSILPSLGPSQAASISATTTKLSTKGFLMLSGSLGTINMMLSLITLYALDKARNGSIVVVSDLITMNKESLIIIIATVLISIPIIITCMLLGSRIFAKVVNKINYKTLSLGTIILLITLIIVIAKPVGLLIALVATSIGLTAYLSDVQKNHLMGALMTPTIFFFLL